MKKILIALLLVVLDQLLKFLLTGKNYFLIKYTENYGAAFSLFIGGRWLFILIGFIVIGLIFYYYKKVEYKWGLIFLLAGTIGNLIDRIVFGYVRDYTSIWIFPIFNLADILNWVGVALIIYAWWKD